MKRESSNGMEKWQCENEKVCLYNFIKHFLFLFGWVYLGFSTSLVKCAGSTVQVRLTCFPVCFLR